MTKHCTQRDVTERYDNFDLGRFDGLFPLWSIGFNFNLCGLPVSGGLMPDSIRDEEVLASSTKLLNHAFEAKPGRPNKRSLSNGFVRSICLTEQTHTIGPCAINGGHLVRVWGPKTSTPNPPFAHHLLPADTLLILLGPCTQCTASS